MGTRSEQRPQTRESGISYNLSSRIVAWRMHVVNYSARASYKCNAPFRFPLSNFTFRSRGTVPRSANERMKKRKKIFHVFT